MFDAERKPDSTARGPSCNGEAVCAVLARLVGVELEAGALEPPALVETVRVQAGGGDLRHARVYGYQFLVFEPARERLYRTDAPLSWPSPAVARVVCANPHV